MESGDITIRRVLGALVALNVVAAGLLLGVPGTVLGHGGNSPVGAPPVDAPPVNAPPGDAPPVNEPPVDAPPVNAPPADAPPENPGRGHGPPPDRGP